MSATTAKPSPSVTAKVEMTPEEARKDLLMLTRLGAGYVQSPPADSGGTFCSCCGSTVISSDRKFHHPTFGLIEIGEKGVIDYYRNKFGTWTEERFGTSWKKMLQQADRKNLPGVIFARLDKETVIKEMFDPEVAKQHAEGYEINDPDHGVASIVWLNQ